MMVLANLQFINSNNIKVEIASQPEAAHGRGSGKIRSQLLLPPSVRGHGKMSVQFSSVAQSCPTLCDPMDYSLPGSSVHGFFHARILDWVAISLSNTC